MKPRDLLNTRPGNGIERAQPTRQLAHYVEVHKLALAAERRAQQRAKETTQ